MADNETPPAPEASPPLPSAPEPTRQIMVRKPMETGHAVAPLIPRTLDDIKQIAMGFIKAKMVPESLQGADEEETHAKVSLVIMKGLELGYGPATAISTIMVINNRPALWGDGALALVQRDRLVVKYESFYEGGSEKDSGPAAVVGSEETDHTPRGTDFPDTYTAVYRVWRVGIAEPFEGKFSVRDAKRGRLWGNTKRDPWIKYPKRMLMNRAKAFALRDGFADAMMGIAIAEEIRDVTPDEPGKTNLDFLGPPAEAVTPGPNAASAVVPEKDAPGESAQAPATVSFSFPYMSKPDEAIQALSGTSDLAVLLRVWDAIPADLADQKAVYEFYEQRRDELAGLTKATETKAP